uniref:HTH araC/xylS-type domain-containing protein n=1 Tax=Plectus sambesii TaxID=2011161 RepID=A0A914WDK8_9BILA
MNVAKRTVASGDPRDIGSERIRGARGPGHRGPAGPISYSPQSSWLIQVSSVRFRPFDQVSAAARTFERTSAFDCPAQWRATSVRVAAFRLAKTLTRTRNSRSLSERFRQLTGVSPRRYFEPVSALLLSCGRHYCHCDCLSPARKPPRCDG